MLDLPVVTQDDNTNVVCLQVKSHTLDSGVKLNHLSCLNLGQAEHTCNTVTNRDDRTEFFQVILQGKIEC